jgi:tetratricopeptide (TPR) repeat protein
MPHLYEVDYRIRRMIFDCLRSFTSQVGQNSSEWGKLCMELAKCFWLGIGTPRDLNESSNWLAKSDRQQEFQASIQALIASHPPTYDLLPRKWAKSKFLGIVNTSNDVAYYREEKQLKESLHTGQQELTDWAAALGDSHWLVLQMAHIEFLKLLSLDKSNEAEQLAKKFIRILTNRIEDSILLTSWKVRLALALNGNGKSRKAKRLLEDELATEGINPRNADWAALLSKLDDEHFVGRVSLCATLANIYTSRKKYRRASTLLRGLLPRACHILGENHVLYLKLMGSLVSVLKKQRQFSEALQINERILHLAEKYLGKGNEVWQDANAEHPRLKHPQHPLYPLIRARKGASFDRDMIESIQSALGNENPRTIEALNTAVDYLVSHIRFEEAMELGQHAIDLSVAISGPESHQARAARKRLRNTKIQYRTHATLYRWGSVDLGHYWLPFRRDPEKFEPFFGPICKAKRRVYYEKFTLNLALDREYEQRPPIGPLLPS